MIRIDGQEYKEMPSDAVFAKANRVWLENLSQVSVLPDLPNATDVRLDNKLKKLK